MYQPQLTSDGVENSEQFHYVQRLALAYASPRKGERGVVWGKHFRHHLIKSSAKVFTIEYSSTNKGCKLDLAHGCNYILH